MSIKKGLITVLVLFFAVSLFSQNIRNKQFSLISYDLAISKDFAEEISGLNSFIENI